MSITNSEKRPRVLIVDDEPDLLDILNFVFTENGCDVETAPNAKVAMELVRKNHYTAVVTDIVMPEMNGKQLLSEIEKMQGYKPYVIMMSGYSLYTPDALEKAGACGYISKPFTREQIDEVVTGFIQHIALLSPDDRNLAS